MIKKKEKELCPLEQEVLGSLKKGALPPAMKQHVKECSRCRDSLLLYQWLGSFSQVSFRHQGLEKNLPDPEFIWEKARTSRRPDKELIKKAMRPLLIPQLLSIIAAIIGIVVLTFGNLAEIKEFFNRHETVFILKSFTSTTTALLKALNSILLPILLVLSWVVIYFLYSIIKPKKVQSHTLIF